MAHDVEVSPLLETSNPLSDDEVVTRLRALCRSSKLFEVEIIDLLVVLQARHLDLSWTYSSLHRFCMERLDMTEGEAARRVAAARMIRRVPALLGYLRAGKLTMTTLLCLANYATEENVDELLPSVASKSKREVQLVLDSREPRPGARVRKRARAKSEEGGAFRLELARGSSVHAKMLRARELMGGAAVETASVLEAALDALLGQLEGQSETVVKVDKALRESSSRVRARVTRGRRPAAAGRRPKSSHSLKARESRVTPPEPRQRSSAAAISEQLRRPLGQRRGRLREKPANDSVTPKRRTRRPARRSE